MTSALRPGKRLAITGIAAKFNLLFLAMVICFCNQARAVNTSKNASKETAGLNITGPTILRSAVTGSITACAGMPSASPNIEQFPVSGSGLTADITASAPSGFEVSLSAGSGYGSSVTLTQAGGVVNSTIIYVRSAASASGSISGNVLLASAGAASHNVAVTGTVNALPTVNPVANQTVINGSAASAVNFTGTGNGFLWTNDTPGIGLAASGTGNIASFHAVNTGSTPITATITATPVHMNNYVYIPGRTSNATSVIDAEADTIKTLIPSSGLPSFVTVSRDGAKVYIVIGGGIEVIDAATNTFLTSISPPVGAVTALAVSPDGTRIYASDQNGGVVRVINTATKTVISTITVGNSPYELSLSPDGSRLYVTNQGSGSISVINTATAAVIATIPVEANFMAFSPDGSLLYAPGGTNVYVIDVATNTILTAITDNSHPQAVAITPDGSKLYVSNFTDNTVSVINTATRTLVATIPVNLRPEGLSITPDGSRVFVAGQGPGNGKVWVISTTTNTLITTIPLTTSIYVYGSFIASPTGCTGVPTTFTITVNPASLNDADLTNFAISSGTLSPVFSSATTSYTATVSNSTSSITVTPTTATALQSIKVNGITVTSGTASASLPLSVGNNTITTVVTAQDGTTTKTYTTTITRISNNANLAGLTLSEGALSPVFAAATTSYTSSVVNAVTSVTVTPTVSDATATIQVNGVTISSGSASAAIPLADRPNIITIVVTAQDGITKKTYTITVNHTSNNAYLESIALSHGTLSPAFTLTNGNYTASVSNDITSIIVTPKVNQPNATFTVNGHYLGISTYVPLLAGDNVITIVVTAQDGVTHKTYRVTVTRATSTADAYLTDLQLTIIPENISILSFVPEQTNYSRVITSTSVTLKPVTSNPGATVTINGAAISSGSTTSDLPIAFGNNTFSVVVTAPDGTTQKTYTIVVQRIPSADASLSALTTSSGTLSPAFSPSSFNYAATVSNSTTSITVTPTTNNAYASVQVNGTAVLSGAASAAIPLSVGNNTINVAVTAQNGTSKFNYVITVTRVSNNAYLSNLTLSSGTLSPAFSSTNGIYSASVSSATSSITVTPTLNNPHGTVIVNETVATSGSPTAFIPLVVGTNTITAVVTAQDGVTKKHYTVTVTRPSNNAYLSSFVLSAGTLSPTFAMTTGSYTASVSNATSSITITPTLNNPHGSIKVNGTTVTSGTASGTIALSVGDNTISTVVTAQDGVTHKTYTVTVTRAMSGFNSLYLPGSDGANPLSFTLNQKVEANNILSPNGDGINDIWVVKNIAYYPNNVVTVFDREGQVVFTKKGYTNDWTGTYRGSVLNEGTYYYSVDLGNGTVSRGFITVVSH